MTEPNQRCTVIVPTYNGATLTGACIAALLANPPTTCQQSIVVVDDGSDDGTPQALERFGSRVRVVRQDRRTGFARACNAGADAAEECEYLVFLNNDTLPTAGWLDALVRDAQSDERVAAVGAKLLFPNGQVQHAGVAIGQDGWPHHLYAGFNAEHPAVNRSREVIAVTAACLLIGRTEFEELGGFDVAFHNGYEDVDLCLRLRQRGRVVRYCADSVVYHLESVTRWPTGTPERTERSERLYERRWRSTVTPDDLDHYLDDGLLTMSYGPHYPMTLTVSPDLAVVRADGEELAGLERLLELRSRQVMDLVSAQIRSQLRPGSYVAPPFQARRPPGRAELLSTGREHRLGESGGRRLISVVIPVKDAEQHLDDLLPRVFEQALPARLEIVAIDSGSRDGTVDTLTRFGATVLSIDSLDFDHGLTRNLAAEHARGEILVFLSQRSRPVGRDWLEPLIAALDSDPAVAGACSRVLPLPGADILTARDVERDLSSSPERVRKQIGDWSTYSAMSPDQRRAFLNFHTVSAAIRTEVWRQIPFRSVRTLGEDLLWAREVLEADWALVHEPASVVRHSHTYTLGELFARNVDDAVANRDFLNRSFDTGQIEPMVRAMSFDDWAFLADTLGSTGEELEHWKLEAVLRRVARAVGQWVGANHGELPEGTAKFFSSRGPLAAGSRDPGEPE